MRPHEPGLDEVTPVRTHRACQGQQRPGEDQVDQERAETSLPQGEEQAGGQGPDKRCPGPQSHPSGHGAGGEPGP